MKEVTTTATTRAALKAAWDERAAALAKLVAAKAECDAAVAKYEAAWAAALAE